MADGQAAADILGPTLAEDGSQRNQQASADDTSCSTSSSSSSAFCASSPLPKGAEVDFKAPFVPIKKSKRVNVSESATDTPDGASEDTKAFVKHFPSTVCPNSKSYFNKRFPNLPEKSPADANTDLLEEMVVDGFSLILFNSIEDYRVFKSQEDEIVEKELEEQRIKALQEARKARKKCKATKAYMEKAQRSLRRNERRERKARARQERREQRRREHQERRARGEVIPKLDKEERQLRRQRREQKLRERQERLQQKKDQKRREREAQKLKNRMMNGSANGSPRSLISGAIGIADRGNKYLNRKISPPGAGDEHTKPGFGGEGPSTQTISVFNGLAAKSADAALSSLINDIQAPSGSRPEALKPSVHKAAEGSVDMKPQAKQEDVLDVYRKQLLALHSMQQKPGPANAALPFMGMPGPITYEQMLADPNLRFALPQQLLAAGMQRSVAEAAASTSRGNAVPASASRDLNNLPQLKQTPIPNMSNFTAQLAPFANNPDFASALQQALSAMNAVDPSLLALNSHILSGQKPAANPTLNAQLELLSQQQRSAAAQQKPISQQPQIRTAQIPISNIPAKIGTQNGGGAAQSSRAAQFPSNVAAPQFRNSYVPGTDLASQLAGAAALGGKATLPPNTTSGRWNSLHVQIADTLKQVFAENPEMDDGSRESQLCAPVPKDSRTAVTAPETKSPTKDATNHVRSPAVEATKRAKVATEEVEVKPSVSAGGSLVAGTSMLSPQNIPVSVALANAARQHQMSTANAHQQQQQLTLDQQKAIQQQQQLRMLASLPVGSSMETLLRHQLLNAAAETPQNQNAHRSAMEQQRPSTSTALNTSTPASAMSTATHAAAAAALHPSLAIGLTQQDQQQRAQQQQQLTSAALANALPTSVNGSMDSANLLNYINQQNQIHQQNLRMQNMMNVERMKTMEQQKIQQQKELQLQQQLLAAVAAQNPGTSGMPGLGNYLQSLPHSTQLMLQQLAQQQQAAGITAQQQQQALSALHSSQQQQQQQNLLSQRIAQPSSSVANQPQRILQHQTAAAPTQSQIPHQQMQRAPAQTPVQQAYSQPQANVLHNAARLSGNDANNLMMMQLLQQQPNLLDANTRNALTAGLANNDLARQLQALGSLNPNALLQLQQQQQQHQQQQQQNQQAQNLQLAQQMQLLQQMSQRGVAQINPSQMANIAAMPNFVEAELLLRQMTAPPQPPPNLQRSAQNPQQIAEQHRTFREQLMAAASMAVDSPQNGGPGSQHLKTSGIMGTPPQKKSTAFDG